jgi:diadenosine tetraphosphate (Ap4A) HIT family hydrolase
LRKLQSEDRNGYWYLVVPKEIGTFGQVLLVVTKRQEDKKHISTIADPALFDNEKRLLSVIKGINEISSKLKERLRHPRGRKAEKVYVLTQCEGEDSHLHFQFLPRYEGDSTRNEFLYACELQEARWQDPPKVSPNLRIIDGKRILRKYGNLLSRQNFLYTKGFKSRKMKEVIQKLNEVLM